mgnify:CR=1 FL=1
MAETTINLEFRNEFKNKEQKDLFKKDEKEQCISNKKSKENRDSSYAFSWNAS